MNRKDYQCKSCIYNYFGYCKKKKIDKLKQNNIQNCKLYKFNFKYSNSNIEKSEKIKFVKVRRVK